MTGYQRGRWGSIGGCRRDCWKAARLDPDHQRLLRHVIATVLLVAVLIAALIILFLDG